MLDVIKEYLVKLGFEVDARGYEDMMAVVGGAGTKIMDFARKAVTQFSLAGAEVIGFLAGTTAAIGKFTSALAKADLDNQIFARQMWTTNQNAWALKKTLDVMGRSMNDLYLSPELMKNFQALRQQGLQMQAPLDFEKGMKQVRDVQFQFQRLKLEGQYALQWIGYYLVKYLGGPLTNIRLELSKLNDAITKQMPTWTKYVAQVLSWFIQLGEDVVYALEYIWKEINNISDRIPDKVKTVGGIIAGLVLLFNAGPVTQFAVALAGAVLLLDDFISYTKGGDSALKDFWKSLDKIYTTMQNTQTFKDLKEVVDDLGQSFRDAWKEITDNVSLQKMLSYLTEIGTSLGHSLGLLYDIIVQIIKLLDLGDGIRALGKVLGVLLEPLLLTVTAIIKALEQILRVVDDVLKGDWKKAWKDFTTGISVDSFSGATGLKGIIGGDGGLAPQLWPSNDGLKNNVSSGPLKPTTYAPVTNIYGSDPVATANAAQKNQDSFYIRNMRGAIM